MKFLLKQLLDSTIFADHTNIYQTHPTPTSTMNGNKCEPQINLHVVQVKQFLIASYFPYIAELFTTNSIINKHRQFIFTCMQTELR